MSILSIFIDVWNVAVVPTKVPMDLDASSLRDKGLDGGYMASGWGPSLVTSPPWNLAHLSSVRWCGLRGVKGWKKFFFFSGIVISSDGRRIWVCCWS